MPNNLATHLDKRLGRLEVCAGISLHSSEIRGGDSLKTPAPLVAVTSSRLGRDPYLHRWVCQFLSRRMLELRHSRSTFIVAAGSAIEPLATRAAELFHVPIVKLVVNKDDWDSGEHTNLCEIQSSEPLSRDAVLIGIADRIDALYVRRGGKIDTALRMRIAALHDTSTRVAVIADLPSAAAELIAEGAIGWYLTRPSRIANGQNANVADPSTHAHIDHRELNDTTWTRSDGQWLTHTTRSCTGPWPGQTEHQYQDELLLSRSSESEPFASGSSPLQTLARIVRSGVIVANAITSSKKYPVVCFSEVPLADRLHKRKFRSHLGRWDDEPYGIAIRLDAAKRLGLKPVIYGDPKQRTQLAKEDQYRFQAKGKTFDWTEQREWRADRSVDLTQLDVDDVRIFLPDAEQAATLHPIADWKITLLGTSFGISR